MGFFPDRHALFVLAFPPFLYVFGPCEIWNSWSEWENFSGPFLYVFGHCEIWNSRSEWENFSGRGSKSVPVIRRRFFSPPDSTSFFFPLFPSFNSRPPFFFICFWSECEILRARKTLGKRFLRRFVCSMMMRREKFHSVTWRGSLRNSGKTWRMRSCRCVTKPGGKHDLNRSPKSACAAKTSYKTSSVSEKREKQ